MDGIEKIIDRISGDAQREVDDVLAQARAEADKILSQYQAQAQAEADDILTRGEKAAVERGERLASVAQLECRKEVLAAKQEVIEEAFQLAMDKLTQLPQEAYVSLLADLAVEASSKGNEKLIFSVADRARVGKAVVVAANEKLGDKGQLTLAQETRPMQGGFILSDGAVEVNCTFETLVRLQRGTLSTQVAGVLFD
ncbi:MAG TPA: V-type ATP synthase subunit E [Candidatus Enterenecus avicola]|nr:V-type ATP synthase subunit E [Candidatus Enterenecus avicola]